MGKVRGGWEFGVWRGGGGELGGGDVGVSVGGGGGGGSCGSEFAITFMYEGNTQVFIQLTHIDPL